MIIQSVYFISLELIGRTLTIQRTIIRSEVNLSCSLPGDVSWYYGHPAKNYKYPRQPPFTGNRIINILVVQLRHAGYYFCLNESQGKEKVSMIGIELRVYG